MDLEILSAVAIQIASQPISSEMQFTGRVAECSRADEGKGIITTYRIDVNTKRSAPAPPFSVLPRLE